MPPPIDGADVSFHESELDGEEPLELGEPDAPLEIEAAALREAVTREASTRKAIAALELVEGSLVPPEFGASDSLVPPPSSSAPGATVARSERSSIPPRVSRSSLTPPAIERGPGREPRRNGREPQSLVGQLAEWPTLSREQRRVGFRQVLAELARGAFDDGPSPLEGIRSDTLTQAVAGAVQDELFDDLDWLSPGQGGAAIFHLAAALPPGTEQRELGRRGFSRLLAADAEAFSTIATQLARAGGRALLTPAVTARVALLFEMPLALELNDTTLAYALASRRTLASRFLVEPSSRSLPERRLAARILERAAISAWKRARGGDRSGLRLVGQDGVLGPVWNRLFADREALVWRHVAFGKGVLTPTHSQSLSGLMRQFGEDLSPTEWRRSIVMLGGLALVDGSLALDLAGRVFDAGLLQRDSGAAAGFVWSLGRVAATDPDLARELFDLAVPKNPADLAEGALALARELGDSPFLEYARGAALARLSSSNSSNDEEGVLALRRELAPREEDLHLATSLAEQAQQALMRFHSSGAAAALDAGQRMLEAARSVVDTLSVLGQDEGSALARRTSFNVVRDLDVGFLERDILANLLRLDTREARVKNADEVVEHLRDRIFSWLVDRALKPHINLPSSSTSGEHVIPAQLDHVALHLGRVRAFLHLVDGDALGRSEDGDRLAIARFRLALRSLVECFESGPPGPLRRAMVAAFARCLDALVRASACDVSDVLLVALNTLREPRDLDALAEAAMDPDVSRLLVAASALWGKQPPKPGGSIPVIMDSILPPSLTVETPSTGLTALDALAEELAEVGTARSDGLRGVLLKLHQGFTAVSAARGLNALSLDDNDAAVLVAIEAGAFALTQLFAGAHARVLDDVKHVPRRSPSSALSSLVLAAMRKAEPLAEGATQLPATVLTAGLSSWFVRMFGDELRALEGLPITAPASSSRPEMLPVELPGWIPSRRTLGAFWVERPLAAGGVGSVFIVTRTEDRFHDDAERFALKVPDYNANAARHLSEEQFLGLFRGEASALVSLPQHESLARFVTFDLAARPKPILVMELVEGPNLERMIDTRALSWELAMESVENVTAGLMAMHQAGVGHLDLKPANVVLRKGTHAVLVDFGLAGRQLRPGCGSAPYAAPEVWNYDARQPSSPMAADMYSLGCLLFETLTADVLFDGDNELNMIAQHLAHDGFPPKLRALASNAKHAALAELLFAVLRRNPADRLDIAGFSAELRRVVSRYKAREWPLPVPRA